MTPATDRTVLCSAILPPQKAPAIIWEAVLDRVRTKYGGNRRNADRARPLRALAAAACLPLLSALGSPGPEVLRIAAEEARQGVASDGSHVYAIDNSRIGKYRISDGRRVAQWSGDPAEFPHLNSCTIVSARLVCASSNYPALPQASSVEIFDPATMRHIGSHSFGIAEGSLTAIDWHDGSWWAVFAHYDGRGGVPGKDASHSQFTRLDDDFRIVARWTFPPAVVERMRPYSVSGASWSNDGRLALSGHDRPEIYLVSLPRAGTVLRLEAILPAISEGQAIDWDPIRKHGLWTIARSRRELVLGDVPDMPQR